MENSVSEVKNVGYVPPSEVRQFLEALWGSYVSQKPLYYEVFCVCGDGEKIIKFFEGPDAARDAAAWLEQRRAELIRRKCHVYAGVYPRVRLPDSGRGSAADVESGLYLFVEFDFKRVFQRPEDAPLPKEAVAALKREGRWFREGDDHALTGAYVERRRVIFVDRPSLNLLLNKVRAIIGAPTLVLDSGCGYHLYFRLTREVDARQLKALEEGLVNALGGDPQAKDLARVMRVPGFPNPRLARPVRVLIFNDAEHDPDEVAARLQHFSSQQSKTTSREEWRHLNEEEKKRIIELLRDAWARAAGRRFAFVGSLAGLFAKSGIAQEDCEEIISKLYEMIGRPDKEHLRDIKYTYSDYLSGRPVAAIESSGSIKGLKPLLEELLGEDEGQTVLLNLLRIVSPQRPRGSLAWLRIVGNSVTRWIDVGKSGIYVKARQGDEIVKEKISKARIKEVRHVKIAGLEKLRNLYRVALENGDVYIGTLEDVTRELRRFHGLKPGTEYALGVLFDSLAAEYPVVSLYYAVGPWIVGDDVVIAEESGYLPAWKPDIRWSLPRGGDVKTALEIIKKIVEAYGDPRVASTVLCYGIVSWAAHWLKEEFSIFPNLVIHGPQETGKTLLLDLLRMIMNIDWSEMPPATDFQARREFAKSTLPYILSEGTDFFKKVAAEDKQALQGIAIAARAATDRELREAGSNRYGGVFLAIRALIVATNVLPQSLTFLDPDKFILVHLGRHEKINLSKVRGITPRTLRCKPLLKQGFAAVFAEALDVFRTLIPTIRNSLKSCSREELANEYIKIGYAIWQKLYEKYGLKPFPPPAPVSVEGQVESIEESYKEAFESYIWRLIKQTETLIGKGSNEPLFKVTNDSAALEAIYYHGGCIYNQEIILRSTFLSRFSVWAQREYALPPLGVRRLAELLDLGKQTSRKIGERIIKPVWVKPWISSGDSHED